MERSSRFHSPAASGSFSRRAFVRGGILAGALAVSGGTAWRGAAASNAPTTGATPVAVSAGASPKGWPTATPEQQGIDSVKLAGALRTLQNRGLNVHGLVVVRRGQLVLDAAFYPYDGKEPHDLASVTKSFTTTLLGIAAGQGKLRLDQPVLSFFPDRAIANRDARKERVTLAHLASMTSGFDCNPGNNEETLTQMRASQDWVQFVLDRLMMAEPGTMFAYCSPGMHLLSAVLTRATGMSTLDFARRVLFAPLGIAAVVWPSDPQGITHGWGDLHLLPKDAARLGQLWLNQGVWNDALIVPRDWAVDAVKVHAKSGGGNDYGYGWWIDAKNGSFQASGRGGQLVQVFPALDAVVATTGGGWSPGEATDLIGPALVDPHAALPANPAGVAHLRETVASLLQPPAPTPVPPLPAIAKLVSGKTYAFDSNPLGMATLRLDFAGTADAKLTVVAAERTIPGAAVGLDGVYRLAPAQYGFPCGLRGTWTDNQTFELEYDEIANLNAYVLQMRYAGDTVALAVRDRTSDATFDVAGRVKRA
jgi:CubicO group peptidase (beta-lactamase class C family)